MRIRIYIISLGEFAEYTVNSLENKNKIDGNLRLGREEHAWIGNKNIEVANNLRRLN